MLIFFDVMKSNSGFYQMNKYKQLPTGILLNAFILETNTKILSLSNISLGNAILVFDFMSLSTNKMTR